MIDAIYFFWVMHSAVTTHRLYAEARLRFFKWKAISRRMTTTTMNLVKSLAE
jgi:hypothetical protein